MNNTIEVRNHEVNSRNALPQVLTDEEVAELFHISRKRVRALFKRGEIPSGRYIGRHLRFHRDALFEWLDEGTGGDASAPADELAATALGESSEDSDPEERREIEELNRQYEERRQSIHGSEEFRLIKIELANLNKILRESFGARKKVTFEPDYAGYKHDVEWGHLNAKARVAITKAARQAFNQDIGTSACCRGLGKAVEFLRGVNEQLAEVSA